MGFDEGAIRDGFRRGVGDFSQHVGPPASRGRACVTGRSRAPGVLLAGAQIDADRPVNGATAGIARRSASIAVQRGNLPAEQASLQSGVPRRACGRPIMAAAGLPAVAPPRKRPANCAATEQSGLASLPEPADGHCSGPPSSTTRFMPSKNPAQRLADIIDNVDDIHAFTAALDFQAFRTDRKTVYAVVRAPEIISEASRRLPNRCTTNQRA